MGNIFSLSIPCDALFSSFQNCFCRKADYIIQLEENLNSLRVELEKLMEAKSDVERRVINGEGQPQMIRTDQVRGWLRRVEAVKAEVDALANNNPQAFQPLCLGGICSRHCISHYKLGEEVVKKKEVVATLMGERNFELLVEMVPEAAVRERPTVTILVGMQKITDKVWKCITEGRAGIIGLYGMGGVGKTTLLTQINNKFVNTQNDFDLVIWVVVSKDARLGKIQRDIGKSLGICNGLWENKTLEEKAHDIFQNLITKKFVLLLDDVWQQVDLIKVGVPLPRSQSRSKIVFTTRSLDVCGSMDARKAIKVKCLTQEESWELFEAKVGIETIESHPDIPRLAKTVARECDGLPLALITIGRAMAFKETPEEWKCAIEMLRRYASDFPDTGEMYPVLKISYDFLSDDKIRSCFLYCSLFPEDEEIDKRELIECWTSEGLLDGFGRSGARNKGYFIIGALLRACLLEKAGDDSVKMHDVIRDLALWITGKVERENENFVVHSGLGLTVTSRIEINEKVKRASFMRNKIKCLRMASCPNLLTLFLHFNELKVITSGFFQFMPSLNVLNLSHNELKELPLSISRLVSLQHLDISYTKIKELPKGLMALVNLKYLNLENVIQLCKIPEGLLSRFSKLQVLRITKYSCMINEGTDNVLYGGAELLVEELLCLEHLDVLCIELRSFQSLVGLLSSDILKSCTQMLRLQGFTNSESFSLSSLADMRDLEVLDISDFEFLEVHRVRECHGFLNLHSFYIDSCSKLTDLTWLIVAPNLKRIMVKKCPKLEEIVSDEKLAEVPEEMTLNAFAKLEMVYLRDLKNLRSIYANVFTGSCLKEISIYSCPKLNKLPLDINCAYNKTLVIHGPKSWWEKLQWEDENTRNAFVPFFKSFEQHGYEHWW